MKTIIKNTNIVLIGGEFIISFTNNAGGYGERLMLITNDVKTVKQYTKAGFFIFGSPELYSNGRFFALTKSLQQKTRNKKQIVIENAMYHINKHIAAGKTVKYEVKPINNY